MKLGAVISTVALGALSLMAQTDSGLRGAFVLAEEGVLANGTPFASLAKVNIASDGSVTGSQIAQDVTYDLQGAYTAEAGGTGTLSLTASAANADGETVIVPLTYKLVRPKAGGAVILRANPGIFATGSLTAAAPAGGLAGTYYLSEEPVSRPWARLAVLTLDPAGSVSGYQIVNAVNGAGKLDLKGAYQSDAAGFTRLTFSSTTTGEDGDSIDTAETYVILADQAGLKALRTGAGGARVIDFEK